jgi:hypothetical protein
MAGLTDFVIYYKYWNKFQRARKIWHSCLLWVEVPTTPREMKLTKYLRYLIDTDHYRLTELSKASGLNMSDLSKIVNGKRHPGGKAVEQLLTGLEPEHRVLALVAWLHDQIPAPHQDLVHIVRSSPPVASEPLDIRSLEGALKALGEQAEANDALRVVITNMAIAFCGDRPKPTGLPA